MAGSFLCSAGPVVFVSWEEVPAGVSGGECIADTGGDGRWVDEGRLEEWPEGVRDAGEGDGA